MTFLNEQQRREYEETKPQALQADIWMISGCEDRQTSADVSNIAAFQLPDPSGWAGGACTTTLLNVLYEDEQRVDDTYSFTEVLTKMRTILNSKGFKQIPQLSSTRPIDMNNKFKIVPDTLSGTRRAVLIGINYTGQKGELRGCHNDVFNMVRWLLLYCEFLVVVKVMMVTKREVKADHTKSYCFPFIFSFLVQLYTRLLWI
jgi:hypothetical protein